ncbi:MAG TPA: PAS domain S-box protein [Kamptonema sp.]|nr:PAS domain S-box protein [Kamptonema sp.]
MMTASSPLNKKKLLSAIASDPLIVTPDTTVMTAIAIMVNRGLSYILVEEESSTNPESSLIGILTKRDIVRIVTEATPLDRLPIHSVMSHPVITVQESALTDIKALLTLLQQQGIHHLPVLDESDRIVGLLTQDTLTEILAQTVLELGDPTDTQSISHQYQRVFSTVADGIALIDRNYIYRLVNQVYLDRNHRKWEEIVGYSVQELNGETIFKTTIKPYLDRCIAAGETQEYEAWFEYEKLGRRFVSVTYSPYIEIDGTISGVVVTTHDRTALKQAETALAEKEQFLRSIYEGVEQAIFTVDVLEDGEFRLMGHNPTAERLTGKLTKEIQGTSPGKKVRRYADCIEAGVPITYEECLVFEKTLTWWMTTLNPIRDASSRICRIVGTSANITERKQAESQLKIQNFILEKIAKADPLSDILDALLQAIEMQLMDAICSIMLCDRDGKLHTGVAPQLPEAYLRATDGVSIGEGVGSCGTAAFRQETVIVSDIATDPLWQDFKELALEHGLRACWSIPIISNDGLVVGTFGVYYREIHTPSQQELSVVALATNIAGIAIERQQATHVLEQLNQELETKVKERTAALVISEERWQLALKGSNDGIWDWNLKTDKIFFSSRWKQMRGFTDDEIRNSPDECLSRIHPDDYDRVMAAVKEHFAGRTEFLEVEYRVKRKDGSYMWVLDRAQVLRDESGEIVRLSGSDSDITQRKLAEEALRESERRYATLAAAAPVAIFRFDAPLNCVYVNDRWSEMTGRPKASALGRGWIEALHPEDRDFLVAKYAQDYAQSASGHHIIKNGEGRHLRPDGSVNWFYVQVAEEINAAGETIGYIGTLTDISDRKQAEAELEKSRQNYYSLIQSVNGIVWEYDIQNNHFTFVSDKAEELLGYPIEAWLTEPNFWTNHVYAEDIVTAEKLFDDAIQNQKSCELEYRMVAADGSLVWVYDISSLKFDQNGNATMSSGVLIDIRKRKQTEAALQLSEERFRKAFDHTVVGMCLVSLEGKYFKVNASLCTFLGYSETELLQLRFQDITHPDDLANNLEFARQILAGEINSYHIEKRYFTKQGLLVWGLLSVSLVRDLHEKPLYFVSQIQDITDRKQAEIALQSSENRFRRMFDSSVVGMIFADFQGYIIDANDRFLQMVGYTREELNAGMIHWDEMTPPEYLPADFAAMDRMIQYGEIDPWEKEYYRKDGSRISVLIGMAFLPDSEDQSICVVVDISDRKQAELALQESQRFIQKIADSSPNILYLYDLQAQRNLYVNHEITSILGYKPEVIQAMGTNFTRNLMHPDDLRLVLPAYSKQISMAQDGEIVETEYRMRHTNGEWRWLHSRDSVFSRDASGKVKQIIGNAQDITERKRLEQAQNRLIAILEASTDYILIADLTGNTIWNNRALKKLRGLDTDAVVTQQKPTDYHPQWAVEMLEQQAIPVAIAKGSWVGENILLDPENQQIPVSQLLLAHKSPQGEVEFFSTIMRDMRIYKEYEQQLERTNAELIRATRLKDEFLANMSHELRTPLNAILGMTEGLQEEVFGSVNESQIKALQTIEHSGEHLLELINDILDIAKIESGQMELECTSVSINHLCQSSLAFIKQLALKKGIQLEIKIPLYLPNLLIDERRIRQVLINLLNNAVKFTPNGGRITLEVSRHRGEGEMGRGGDGEMGGFESLPSPPSESPRNYLRIAIIDTGIGIAPENINKLFQPFIQIDSALNRQYAGTGLGLALVKRIVELHGGEVGLTSEVGVGSCFTIYLPDNTTIPFSDELESQDTGGIEPSPTPQSGSPLILLVEDNEANIITLSSYLGAKGYRIILAKNGQEAIDFATTHQPNLILMDIQMPGMDGLEAMRQIRLNPNLVKIPIVALTALAMTGDRERCIAAGADDYITKPIKLKQLAATIQELLPPQSSSPLNY